MKRFDKIYGAKISFLLAYYMWVSRMVFIALLREILRGGRRREYEWMKIAFNFTVDAPLHYQMLPLIWQNIIDLASMQILPSLHQQSSNRSDKMQYSTSDLIWFMIKDCKLGLLQKIGCSLSVCKIQERRSTAFKVRHHIHGTWPFFNTIFSDAPPTIPQI